jgi:hypothetical protein
MTVQHDQRPLAAGVPDQRRAAGKRVRPELNRRCEPGQPGDAGQAGKQGLIDVPALQNIVRALALLFVHTRPLVDFRLRDA